MYALSKTPISFETAQTIVAAHFGGQAKIERYTELTDGFYNAAYLMELADGHKSVLKAAPPDHVKVLRYESSVPIASTRPKIRRTGSARSWLKK